MGVLENGEVPAPVPFDDADAGALGAVLFEAAQAAAGKSSSSGSSSTGSEGSNSVRDSQSPTPSIDNKKANKKRKREESE